MFPVKLLNGNSDTMRLLTLQNDEDLFQVVDFSRDHVPPYAILSHTWSLKDGEEVTLADFKEPLRGSFKPGHRKLRFCASQAAQDGLEYFWVDTCCIDRSNSAELSEAINSMFKWYSRATKCYVYLDDMTLRWPDGKQRVLSGECPLSFYQCRWFKRGWTLQELLAPKVVEFYDRDWYFIGTRSALAEELATYTSIPLEILITSGASRLHNFSVAQRMSWASARETRRREDLAYCLLGIFDVKLPVLYGEGKRAFLRLQHEIMNRTNDWSIFAWMGDGLEEGGGGLLAESPSAFRRSGDVALDLNPLAHSWIRGHSSVFASFRMLYLVSSAEDGREIDAVAMLPCKRSYSREIVFGLALQRESTGRRWRRSRRSHNVLLSISACDASRASAEVIEVMLTSGGWDAFLRDRFDIRGMVTKSQLRNLDLENLFWGDKVPRHWRRLLYEEDSDDESGGDMECNLTIALSHRRIERDVGFGEDNARRIGEVTAKDPKARKLADPLSKAGLQVTSRSSSNSTLKLRMRQTHADGSLVLQTESDALEIENSDDLETADATTDRGQTNNGIDIPVPTSPGPEDGSQRSKDLEASLSPATSENESDTESEDMYDSDNKVHGTDDHGGHSALKVAVVNALVDAIMAHLSRQADLPQCDIDLAASACKSDPSGEARFLAEKRKATHFHRSDGDEARRTPEHSPKRFRVQEDVISKVSR